MEHLHVEEKVAVPVGNANTWLEDTTSLPQSHYCSSASIYHPQILFRKPSLSAAARGQPEVICQLAQTTHVAAKWTSWGLRPWRRVETKKKQGTTMCRYSIIDLHRGTLWGFEAWSHERVCCNMADSSTENCKPDQNCVHSIGRQSFIFPDVSKYNYYNIKYKQTM